MMCHQCYCVLLGASDSGKCLDNRLDAITSLQFALLAFIFSLELFTCIRFEYTNIVFPPVKTPFYYNLLPLSSLFLSKMCMHACIVLGATFSALPKFFIIKMYHQEELVMLYCSLESDR